MNLPPLKIGDELILRRVQGNPNDRVATVTKLGRKWAHAAPTTGWGEVKFDMVTGYEDGRGFMSHHRLLTPEMDAVEQRIKAARTELHEKGVRFEPWAARGISVETIEAIAAILRESEETDR